MFKQSSLGNDKEHSTPTTSRYEKKDALLLGGDDPAFKFGRPSIV